MQVFSYAKYPLMVFVLSTLSCNFLVPGSRFSPEQIELAEKRITEDPRYKSVDLICSEMVMPAETTFVGKAHLENSVGIIYFFHTKSPVEELEAYIDDQLVRKSWVWTPNSLLTRSQTYDKAGYSIRISTGSIAEGVNASIACTNRETAINAGS